MTAADDLAQAAANGAPSSAPGELRRVVEARSALGEQLRERARAGGHDVGPCSWQDAPDHAVAMGRCRRCRLMAFLTVRGAALTWWGQAIETECPRFPGVGRGR